MSGMKVLLAAVLSVGFFGGCVWKSAYDDQVAINQHLSSVKTEQDIERDGLHADVNALNRAYSGQSLRLTAVEGIIVQVTNQLKESRERVTALTQEQTLLRADMARVTAQSNEALVILRDIASQQEVTSASLSSLSGKVDGLRKTAALRAEKGIDVSSSNIQKPKGQDGLEKGRGKPDAETPDAIQRPVGQRPEAAPGGAVLSGVMKSQTGPSEPQVPNLTMDKTGMGGPGGEVTAIPPSARIETTSLPVPVKGQTLGEPVAVPSIPSSPVPPAVEEVSPLVQKKDESQPVAAKPSMVERALKYIGFGSNKSVQTAQKPEPGNEKKQ
jgi:hypothetical protein